MKRRTGKQATVSVIIETPRGCRNKYKHDPKTGHMKLSKVMPEA